MERLPFVRKFQWKFSVSGMVLVLFWYRKQEERDWGVPFTKYRLNSCFLSSWSVAIVIQTNGTENFGRFCKNGKRWYLAGAVTICMENPEIPEKIQMERFIPFTGPVNGQERPTNVYSYHRVFWNLLIFKLIIILEFALLEESQKRVGTKSSIARIFFYIYCFYSFTIVVKFYCSL